MMARSRAGRPYTELVCVMKPERVEEIDALGYWQANPDVKQAGIDARHHFIHHGRQESRMQWTHGAEIARLRDEKLGALRFKTRPAMAQKPGEAVNFLSRDAIERFDIPEAPPVSANPYGPHLIEEIRANPDKLFLDLGAGLRETYYANVVNAEIYPSFSTDVVCVGEDLPFADEQFDYVLAFAVLEHTRKPWEVASEMCRVLKPGGAVWVDYPFMQAVHAYPHHYFNATPQGNRSLFEDWCDIRSLSVNQNQHPIYSLEQFLRNWRSGLAEADAARFGGLTVDEILTTPLELQRREPWCVNLPQEVQKNICAGTTLIGVKKPRPAKARNWLRRMLRRAGS